jgi:uncharacterized protein YceK
LYYAALSHGKKGKPVIRAVAFLTLLPTTIVMNGCGTIASVCSDQDDGKGKMPYSGTTRCVEAMKSTLFDDNLKTIPNSRAICFAFWLCDLPLSITAGTVVLPFTLTYTLANTFQPSGEMQPTRVDPSQQAGPVGQIWKSQDQE